ncbi:MAG: D-aminoacylase, partial [Acidobacteria bacterium]|nr:D-aminoacylase [Acidobacteriota bacterium]
MRFPRLAVPLLVAALIFSLDPPARSAQPSFDIIIRGGTVYDGTGAPGRRADVGIQGDRIGAIGDLTSVQATSIVDATGLAVAPGFINMLSWSTDSLLVDGRSQGEIREGVTTQIFGEGDSMGPLTPEMKRRAIEQMGDLKFSITWTTLSEYLKQL